MNEVRRILMKYPERCPLLIYPYDDFQQKLDKNKFIVPNELTIINLIFIIKKRLNIGKDKSLIFLIGHNQNTIIPELSSMIISLYNKYHDNDGFLRIFYFLENAFGSNS